MKTMIGELLMLASAPAFLLLGVTMEKAVTAERALPQPTLIAYGCEGATGPLYAFEESDLPRCREIVDRDYQRRTYGIKG
jgi:hypothetical protein